MYPHTSKRDICVLFGNSRQAWYENKKRQSELQMQEVFILKLAGELRKDHKRMGAEKLHHLLSPVFTQHNIKYGRDKFFNLLAEHGLLVKRRKRRPVTTNSNHFYRRYPNLIRDISLASPGKLWVSDITYLRTQKGFVYLSLITDAYSKKIVGWCLWPDLTSTGALNALKMAISGEQVIQGLIHHSDRGIQYCCTDYVTYMKGSKIEISMTENGDPYENAIAERVNGILKEEYDLHETFTDYLAANEAVKIAVNKYNNHRPHASCDYMVPSDAHQSSGELKKRWYPKKWQKSSDHAFENAKIT